jgi:hypothetical protein
MRRAFLFGSLACCALATVWSCGLDDSTVVAIDGADGSTLDGSPRNDSSTDSGITDSGGGDTGIVDAGPCPASDLTTCDNGICSSSTQVCAPPVAAGWTVVNLISGSRPACSAGYAARDIVEVADGGAAACACSCSPGDEPSCGNDSVVLGSGNATCDQVHQGFSMTGTPTSGCVALSLSIGSASPYEAAVTTTTACDGLLDASIPNVDAGLGRECDLQPDAGSAALCENHRSCVPKPSTGHICVAHAAPATCPSGFTVSYQSSVANNFNDSRSCPACECGWNSDGCGNPVVTFHTAASCGTSGGDMAVPVGACGSVSGAFLSLGVTGSAGAAAPSCGVIDGGVVDGGVAITNDEVVCCSN